MFTFKSKGTNYIQILTSKLFFFTTDQQKKRESDVLYLRLRLTVCQNDEGQIEKR